MGIGRLLEGKNRIYDCPDLALGQEIESVFQFSPCPLRGPQDARSFVEHMAEVRFGVIPGRRTTGNKDSPIFQKGKLLVPVGLADMVEGDIDSGAPPLFFPITFAIPLTSLCQSSFL